MVGERVHTILGTEEFGGLGSSLALASLTVRGGVHRWPGGGERGEGGGGGGEWR